MVRDYLSESSFPVFLWERLMLLVVDLLDLKEENQ